MKKKLLILMVCFSTFAFTQVVLNQKDDFEDYTTKNWAKNNSITNQNIYDGGPLGVGDNFLRVTSSGTGSNLELMTLNNAQWTGNYWQSNGANRIKYISMDVRNFGSNVIFLRMSFRNTLSGGSPIEIWCSTNPIAILPNTGWQTINFPIDEANMVRFSGINPYSTAFGGIEEARILHSDVPSWNGKPLEAILDIDNIMARNSPLLSVKDTQNNKKEIKIVPNPTADFLVIQSIKNENFSFRIFDFSGKIVRTGNSENNKKIDIKELAIGLYFFQIETDYGQNQIMEFIKK